MLTPFAALTALQLGRRRRSVRMWVATLQRGRMEAGWHTLAWDGRSRAGSRAAAGIYLLRVVVAARTFDRRLVVMP